MVDKISSNLYLGPEILFYIMKQNCWFKDIIEFSNEVNDSNWFRIQTDDFC